MEFSLVSKHSHIAHFSTTFFAFDMSFKHGVESERLIFQDLFWIVFF